MQEVLVLFAVMAFVVVLLLSKLDKGKPSINALEKCKWTKWTKVENGDTVFWRRECKRSGIIQKSLVEPKRKAKAKAKAVAPTDSK